MNILFVLENYFPHHGGAEVLFKNLAEGLVNYGHDVTILAHKLKNTKNVEVINGVEIHRISCFNSRYLFTIMSIPLVMKLAKRVDIIHSTTFIAAGPAWLASKILKKPCVLSVLEVWVGKWREFTQLSWFSSKVHDLLERCIYFLDFDKYVCVSKSTRKQLLYLGINKCKVNVVYNGIDYHHWNPKRYSRKRIRSKFNLNDSFVYLFYGRPGTSKGLEYLLNAIPAIKEKIPNSKFLGIVSKDKAYIKNYNFILGLIKKLKIKDAVTIVDPVSYDDLPSYVESADCVVVPSLSEGFGFSVAEACAMQKPVVASRTTSIPEVISGKYILVEPRNSEEIASGIIKVQKGKYAKKPLKRFLWKDCITEHISIYQKLICT